MRERKPKITLIIYCLENETELELMAKLKEEFEVDKVLCLVAQNQLEHLQYPYMVLEEF